MDRGAHGAPWDVIRPGPFVYDFCIYRPSVPEIPYMEGMSSQRAPCELFRGEPQPAGWVEGSTSNIHTHTSVRNM